MTGQPLDVVAVRADDDLVEHVRAGHTPDSDLGRLLAAWHAEVNR